MSIYKKIEFVMYECHKIDTDFKHTKSMIEELKATGKHNIAINIKMRKRALINDKKFQKEKIICAILGISEIEYKLIFSKTTHIEKLSHNSYLFLENGFKLQEVKYLHSNSIKMICELMNIELK